MSFPKLVLLVTMHLALCFFPSCRQAQLPGIMAGMVQMDSLRGEIFADMVPMVHTADNCGVSAVAVLPGRRHLFRDAELQCALSGRCSCCAG